MISNSKFINIRYDLNLQRIMVKLKKFQNTPDRLLNCLLIEVFLLVLHWDRTAVAVNRWSCGPFSVGLNFTFLVFFFFENSNQVTPMQ